MSFNSPANSRASSVWPGVDGTVAESASDWEPTETYFKKRSKTEMFMGKIKDWQESTTRPREHKHKTRFILAIQDGVPYVNKASPHDDSSPPWHYPCFVPDLRLHAPSGPGDVYARPHARHLRNKAGSNGHVPGGVEAGDPSRRTGGKTGLYRSHPPDAAGGRQVRTPG